MLDFLAFLYLNASIMKAKSKVVSDPQILGGTPVVSGTRVPVASVLAAVRAGMTTFEIFRHYPSLPLDGVEACLGWVKAGHEVETIGLAEYIRRLAASHEVTYEETDCDVWASALTRLSDDQVEMDDVELLIIALERAGVLASRDVVPLHVSYLREKLSTRPG